MNEKEFISLLKDYFENARQKFGTVTLPDGNPEEFTEEEETLMSYYKAWLVLILNMIDIITDDGVQVASADYLAYYALKRDEKSPYGPADITIHEILGLFTHDELESMFGSNFLIKYLKLDVTLTNYQ